VGDDDATPSFPLARPAPPAHSVAARPRPVRTRLAVHQMLDVVGWTQRRTARIAMPQARCHPPTRDLLTREAGGDGGLEALHILKRRLSDVVYRALQTDAQQRLRLTA
jgi:hypothetical protein